MGQYTKRIMVEAMRQRLNEVQQAMDRLERTGKDDRHLHAADWYLREALSHIDRIAEGEDAILSEQRAA